MNTETTCSGCGTKYTSMKVVDGDKVSEWYPCPKCSLFQAGGGFTFKAPVGKEPGFEPGEDNEKANPPDPKP